VERRIADRRREHGKDGDGRKWTPDTAARMLVEHLYEQRFPPLLGIDIGTAYALADENARVGGDLIDVYQFNNGSLAISIADISGRGLQAATRAALVKYALRAYVSSGFTPAQVLRNLNILYLETNAYSPLDRDSFVSVFLGIVDPERHVMTYASGGHDAAMFMSREGALISLPPTAPIVGVLENSPKLFHQRFITLQPGTSTLVLGTDGLTEARSPDGSFIALQTIMARVHSNRDRSAQEQADDLLQSTFEFCGKKMQDDVAIVVARFG
jgi:sigma-B regulation protein RsbU (phosphoserine phosphatase)